MNDRDINDITRDRLNADHIKKDVNEGISQVRNNIRQGLKTLVLAVGRIFIESWIVQEIWNQVIVEATTAVEVTYWQAFFGLLMIRLITGQFKINLEFGNKDNNEGRK